MLVDIIRNAQIGEISYKAHCSHIIVLQMEEVLAESDQIYERYVQLHKLVSEQRAKAEAEFEYFKIGQAQIQQQIVNLKDMLGKGPHGKITKENHEKQRELLRIFKELQQKYQPSSLIYPWRRNQIIQLNLQLKRRPAAPKLIEQLAIELKDNKAILKQKLEETQQKIKEARSKSARLHEQRCAIQAQLQHLQDTSKLQTTEEMFVYNKNYIKMSRITEDILFTERQVKEMVEYCDKLKNEVLVKIARAIDNYANIADLELSRGTTFEERPLSLISRTMTG